MFCPDCICSCSFSTTSPSPIRSWVTLMPVMRVKAGARTLASYSWVVKVSDATLIAMPEKGLAASTNHCISLSCSARLSTETSPISASRNTLAACMSARAVACPRLMVSNAALTAAHFLMIPLHRMGNSLAAQLASKNQTRPGLSKPSERQPGRKLRRPARLLSGARQKNIASPC